MESWQKTLEQNEFKLSAPGILNEVTVLQLGLPAELAEFINARLGNASREAKVKVGQMWKNTRISQTMGSSATNSIGMPSDDDDDDDGDPATDGTLIDNFNAAAVTTAMMHTREQGTDDAKEWESDPDKAGQWQDASDKAGQIIRNFEKLIGGKNATGADLIKADKVAQRFFKKGINGTIPDLPYKLAHDTIFDEVIERGVGFLDGHDIDFPSGYEKLFDYLNDDPDGKHYEIIKSIDLLDNAMKRAKEELVGRENPDQIIKKYDDGYYWYDIKSTSCEIEGDKMGHCGADAHSTTMYSLRSPNNKPDVEFGRDHWVTVAYDEKKKIVHQIKGQNNKLPDKKHLEKIVDLLKSIEVKAIEERGQHTSDKEGFLDFRKWLMSELQLEEEAWDEIKKLLMSFVHKFQEEEGHRGLEIGFRMEKDEDGVIRYFPRALFSAGFPADILNELGKKKEETNGQAFGENVAIRLSDNEIYKYAPDSSKTIHNFYYADVDPETNEDFGGPGSRQGRSNAAYVRNPEDPFNAKFYIFTPLDVAKIMGPWILDGSAAIPGDRGDRFSFANFFDVMKGVSKQESGNLKEGVREAMLDTGYIEGAVFADIEQSIFHEELYTRGTRERETDSEYRNFPTDWKFELTKEDDILEDIMAISPTLTLNTAALLDEHNISSIPGGLDGIKSLFREAYFGREFLQLLFEKVSKNEWSFTASPNQAYLDVRTPWESRPHILDVDWAMAVDKNTKDAVSKDFLSIVSKINIEDDIKDIAEEAFINTVKKKFPEDKLDESIIRMWKRAIM